MEDILDDLCSRFLLNVPEEDLTSFERICFQIEQAHWFYEDFYRENDPSLPGFSFDKFFNLTLTGLLVFHHCPILLPHAHLADEIVHQFKTYKGRVPVCGAILLDSTMDNVLLVKGYTSKSSWSFPRGKINQDEQEWKCAIREVYEETSYDISNLINEKVYLEVYMKEQRVRLFIIHPVPEDYPFAPRTRKEISKIEWHPVSTLPSSKATQNDNYMTRNNNGSGGKPSFFSVIPFSKSLKRWIRKYKLRNGLVDDIYPNEQAFVNGNNNNSNLYYTTGGSDFEESTMVASTSSKSRSKHIAGLETGSPGQKKNAGRRRSSVDSAGIIKSPNVKKILQKAPYSNQELNTTTTSQFKPVTIQLDEGSYQQSSSESYSPEGKVNPIPVFEFPAWLSFQFDVEDILNAASAV